MAVKQIKIRDANGVAHYEDVLDIDGIIDVAILAWADGERNERLRAFLEWLATFGNKRPTGHQFINWMESHGGKFIPIEPEEHEN